MQKCKGAVVRISQLLNLYRLGSMSMATSSSQLKFIFASAVWPMHTAHCALKLRNAHCALHTAHFTLSISQGVFGVPTSEFGFEFSASVESAEVPER